MGDHARPGPFIALLNWVSGSGAKYDTASTKALPEGTAVTVPAGGILYDGCKEALCLVEIVGDGDDPEFMVDDKGKTIFSPPSDHALPGAAGRP